MVVERLNRRHARVKLPKLGWVKFRLSRPLGWRWCCVRRRLPAAARHWFVSFLVDDGRETPAAHAVPGSAVGLDRGVVAAIATSDSQLIDHEFLIPIERQRVARLQRQLSRCRRRGRNRDKTRAALAEIRGRERHRRRDFCAQAAHRLASANAVVVLEDLKTRQMTRSAKGTLDQPGRNVRDKSGLNRAILAKGWHQFALALSSVCPLHGYDCGDGASAAHFATLLGVWAGGSEVP